MHDSNPYAAPLTTNAIAAAPSEWPANVPGLWRAGPYLVASRQAEFPLVCPATNEPAVARVPSYFPWARKDLYPLRFGFVVGVLYWLSNVKHTLLYVPITARDRMSRAWRLIVGITFGVAAVVLIGLLFALTTQQAAAPRQPGRSFLEKEGPILGVTAAAFACLTVALFVLHGMPDPTRSLKVHEVAGDVIYLEGAHPEYLARLPHYLPDIPSSF